MAKRRILLCDILPEAPASARSHLGIAIRRMILISVDRALGTASVCDKYQIIFRQNNALFHAFYLAVDRFCNLASVFDLKNDIGNFGIELEVNAHILQILLHRKDQRLILIVLGKFQCAEIRQSRNMMDKSLEIQFHLKRAVPVLKRKHRSPVQPECGIKHFLIKYILDLFVVEILVLRKEQFHDLHASLLA